MLKAVVVADITAAVDSVSNSDGTLTISPTTGAVVASVALGHANTWTGQQTFVAPILGAATATSINKVAFTAPATSATLTIADGATVIHSGAFSTTITSTAATSVTLPTVGVLANLGSIQAIRKPYYMF